MKQLLVPVVLITLVFAIALGYYVINQKTPGGNPLRYGESTAPSSTAISPTQTAGMMQKSVVTPTATVRDVDVDDLETTLNSIDLTDLNDSMSDLQTE